MVDGMLHVSPPSWPYKSGDAGLRPRRCPSRNLSLFASSEPERPGRAEQIGSEVGEATPTHESLMRSY